MKTYEVRVCGFIAVRARNEDEAVDQALFQVANGEVDLDADSVVEIEDEDEDGDDE